MTTRRVFAGGSAAPWPPSPSPPAATARARPWRTTLQNAAVVVADATMEDVTLATTPFGFGALGTSPSLDGEQEGPGEPGGRHGIGGNLSGTREVTFYDARGNVQDALRRHTTEEHPLPPRRGRRRDPRSPGTPASTAPGT